MNKLVLIVALVFFGVNISADVIKNQNTFLSFESNDEKDLALSPFELVYKYCIDKRYEKTEFEPAILYKDSWDFRTQAEHETFKYFIVRNFWKTFKVTYHDIYTDDDMDDHSRKKVEIECN